MPNQTTPIPVNGGLLPGSSSPDATSGHGGTLEIHTGMTATIATVPPDFIEQVGIHLPGRSLLNLSQSCRGFREVLAPLVAWRHCEQRMNTARNGNDFRHIIATAQPCRLKDRVNIYRMLAYRLSDVPKDQRRESAGALIVAAEQIGGSVAAARVRIDVLNGQGYRMAYRGKPWLADLEAWLRDYMLGEPARERACLMADYLQAVRELPEPQRKPAYWVQTLRSFPATKAAATLIALTSWLFPPSNVDQCSAAFQALLAATRWLKNSDGTPSPAQAQVLLGLLDIMCHYRMLGADRPSAWTLTYEAAVELPAELKAEVFCGLVRQLDACSGGRDSIDGKWKKLYAAASDLPAPHLTRVLLALVGSFNCRSWSEAADMDSDSDSSGKYLYDKNPRPATVQARDDRAQMVVSQRCEQVFDLADRLPPTWRNTVLKQISAMLAMRRGCWSHQRYHALQRRLPPSL
jgi:hypothetical protein